MATTATMEFSVEPAGPCRKRVKVKIPTELVKEQFEKSYRQWSKSVPIRGFRPGKAPRSLVEKRFGKDIAQEVKQSLLDAAFDEALKEKDLAPIADPELDLETIAVEPGHPVDFDFHITVKPEFELPSLKDISVAVPSAEPTKAELDGAMRGLRKRKATLRPVEKDPIATEDVVSLKIRGTREQTELFHHENLPYEVGSRMLGDLIADGLDEELEGKHAGVTVKAKAFAPPHRDDHPLAGMELEVEAEVLDVKRPELPKVDDAFAKSYDFDTKAELLEMVTSEVRRQKERDREQLIDQLALAQLVEKADIELPADLIEREVEDMCRRAAYELQMRGESEEEIAKKITEIRARRAEESAREMKAFFILDKIVEKERILVTENEVREAVAQIAAYNQKAPEAMYTALRDSGRLGSLRNQLREKKARAKLRQEVQVTDAPKKAAADKKTTAKKKATKKKKAKDA